VDYSRGCKEIPSGLLTFTVTGRRRSSLIVEAVKAAKRIDNASFKRRKKLLGLPQKPSAMAG